MNLLGLAYLPFLWLDFTVFFRGQLVRPLLHLALFVLLVKLYALNRERDKWHALIGIFFVFLAAMGTSVHPTILLYMVAFLAAAAYALARFAYLHVLSGFGHRELEPGRLPLAGFVTVSTVATLAVAVPLFVVLPRMRTPYIAGRGSGSGTIVHAAGFTDEMSLDVASSVRDNRSVALRMQYQNAPAGSCVSRRRPTMSSRDHLAASPSASCCASVARWSPLPGRGGNGRGPVTIYRQRMESMALPLPGRGRWRWTSAAPPSRSTRAARCRSRQTP